MIDQPYYPGDDNRRAYLPEPPDPDLESREFRRRAPRREEPWMLDDALQSAGIKSQYE